jgi:signal peptidase
LASLANIKDVGIQVSNNHAISRPVKSSRRTIRIVQNILGGLLATAGLISVVIVLVSVMGGYDTFSVASGSMQPTISTGSLIFTSPTPASQLNPGDIITVARVDVKGQVTHRITKIEPNRAGHGQFDVTLKGDANTNPDAHTYVITDADRYRFGIPIFGYLVTGLRKHALPVGVIVLATIAAAMVGRTRVSVTMPDGSVITDLTKHEAENIINTYMGVNNNATADLQSGGDYDYATRHGLDVHRKPDNEKELGAVDTTAAHG